MTGNRASDPGAAERRPGIAENGKPFESVWDFPRPPALEVVPWSIRIVHNGITVVDAPTATRVLETSQPPAYYVDPQFVNLDLLVTSAQQSFCEWKGMASYASVEAEGSTAKDCCWRYPEPTARFASIAGYWAFYAQVLDECYIDDERVAPNPGSFYGGWLTSQVTGPVKGAAGTSHW